MIPHRPSRIRDASAVQNSPHEFPDASNSPRSLRDKSDSMWMESQEGFQRTHTANPTKNLGPREPRISEHTPRRIENDDFPRGTF